MSKKDSRKIGECIYCGKIGPLSVDHIPPKSLFQHPRPNNLITVPSCDDCNKGAQKDDDYFTIRIIPQRLAVNWVIFIRVGD